MTLDEFRAITSGMDGSLTLAVLTLAPDGSAARVIAAASAVNDWLLSRFGRRGSALIAELAAAMTEYEQESRGGRDRQDEVCEDAGPGGTGAGASGPNP